MAPVVLLLGALLSAGSMAHTPAPALAGQIDYDTFMAQKPIDRVRELRRLSAENQADLLSTHIGRWRDANNERLNAEQRQMISEWLAHVTPDLYREPNLKEKLQSTRDLQKRTEALFSRDEMAQAFTLGGDPVPARK